MDLQKRRKQPEIGGLFTRTEYDDIRLGPPRRVRSWSPWHGRYVTDVVQPILAAVCVTPATGEEALEDEPMPRDGATPLERVVAALRKQPMTTRELADKVGTTMAAIGLHLRRRPEIFEPAGHRDIIDSRGQRCAQPAVLWRVRDGAVIVDAAQTYYAQRNRQREAALLEVIRRDGQITLADASTLIGVGRTATSDLIKWSSKLCGRRQRGGMVITEVTP